MNPPRLAVIRDFPEERWPSMDLYGEMLLDNLQAEHATDFRSLGMCPSFRHVLSRLPVIGRRNAAANADRLFNRFWSYPRHLRRRLGDFDLFHVCDHSYAHLVHVLPPDRTGVYCHDLDAFRCLLDPRSEPRPGWFLAMSRRILSGLQAAALVFHSTAEVRRQIVSHGLIDPARLVHAPYGPAPEFVADSVEPDPVSDAPFLLHVGSVIPRKRLDVALDVFASVRKRYPDLKLVQVGGSWRADHQERIARLGIESAVTQLRGLERRSLASLYRHAALVLLPSAAEGFGLPVIEALACGAVVVASDIPVLREVGGDACVYCPVGDVPHWIETVARILADLAVAPTRTMRLQQAGLYSWKQHTRSTVDAYRRLAAGLTLQP